MLSKIQQEKLMAIAIEIYGDFIHYGEILQTDENGEYSEHTAIGKLEKFLTIDGEI